MLKSARTTRIAAVGALLLMLAGLSAPYASAQSYRYYSNHRYYNTTPRTWNNGYTNGYINNGYNNGYINNGYTNGYNNNGYNNGYTINRYYRYHSANDYNTSVMANAHFTSDDKTLLRDYLNQNPGLVGQTGSDWLSRFERMVSLPLGTQQRIIVGSSLPSDLNNQLQMLPLSANQYLGIPVADFIRVGVVGDDAILLDTRTNNVLDVMYNAL